VKSIGLHRSQFEAIRHETVSIFNILYQSQTFLAQKTRVMVVSRNAKHSIDYTR